MSTGEEIEVVVNGEVRVLSAGTPVADLVADLAPGRAAGVAVAVNDEVITRSAWPAHVLAAGDRVEVVAATQGG